MDIQQIEQLLADVRADAQQLPEEGRLSVTNSLLTTLMNECDIIIKKASILQNLRAGGWKVACHNDYTLHGVAFTFWLFTNGIYCAKGEGPSDYEALVGVQQKVAILERNM